MSNSLFNHIATVADGVVVSGMYMAGYASVASSIISKFDSDGIVKWCKNLKDGVLGMSIVGDNVFTNVMKNDNMLISMINMQGDLVNNVDISGRCSGMVKIHDGHIYDICNDDGMGSLSCTDMTGQALWRSYLGSFHDVMEFTDFTISRDGFIYAVGSKNCEHSDKPIIGKWDLSGRELWVRAIEDVDSGFNSVSVDNDGFIYVSGYDSLVTKWDEDGNLIWKYITYNGHNMRSITTDKNGYVYVAGRKSANSYLFKWNKDGKLVWEKMIENGDGVHNIITQIVTNNEDIFTIGVEVGKNNNSRGVLSRWDQNASLKWSEHLS